MPLVKQPALCSRSVIERECRERGSLLCIFSMCAHAPPSAVVLLKALLCVCEWCESYSENSIHHIMLGHQQYFNGKAVLNSVASLI